jgi:hypothetical protein
MSLVFVGMLLVILGTSLWLLLTVDPKRLMRAFRYGFVIALVLFGLFLAATGRGVLDLPLGGVLIMVLRGWFASGVPGIDRLKDWLRGSSRPAGGSTIETTLLRMTLDRSTGALAGEILAGPFQGAQFHQLNVDQLRAFLSECEAADGQSARLVETYLDRTYPDWRDGAESSDRQAGGKASARMTPDEAAQVLGLKPGANAEQIRDAHRTLMMKLHPDHGGSTYLASKINTARDVLLGE